MLIALRLDERIRNQSAGRTAEQILTAVRQARSLLNHQVSAVTAETVGLDSQTGQAILASYARHLADETESDDAGR